MKKLVSVLLILGMLFAVGTTYAETDYWQMYQYMQAYQELEGFTQQLMELTWSMLEILNEKIDSSNTLSESEVDLYFEYCMAILQLKSVSYAQNNIWASMSSDMSDVMNAGIRVHKSSMESYKLIYDMWKQKENHTYSDIATTLEESLRFFVEYTIFPERAKLINEGK